MKKRRKMNHGVHGIETIERHEHAVSPALN